VFRAHIETTFESAHANGPEGHKCHVMHGHSWVAEIEWEYGPDQQDAYGWGPDFGAAKGIIRNLDHQNLNEVFEFAPSAENIAKWMYEEFERMFGFFPDFVRLHEGRGNTMTYSDPAND